jgi:hypothetical protein
MPGQAGVCFSCGQPLPRDLGPADPSQQGANVPAVPDAPSFPLTGAMQSPLEPPPNPYGSTVANSASIIGAAGQFAIRAGIEVKVGRDPAQCPITLSEPRVSGVHATLKFEAGQLFVRDEGSNNGSYINGSRLPAQTWTPVPGNATLKFGPVEFRVKLE